MRGTDIIGEGRVSVESSVASDVQRDRAPFDEDSRDEQKAVADGRVLLAAHQRDAVLLDPLLDPLDPAEKARDAGERRVQHMPFVVVAVGLGWAATEFFTEKQVLPSGSNDLALQYLTIELRVIPRIRLRPDIDQHIDLVLAEQCDEILARVIGVPNREEATFGNNKVRQGRAL